MDEAAATKNLINWLHADPKADEDQARRLLAKLLRTTRPLDLGLRFAPGDLFDPDLKQEQGCYLAIKRVRGQRKAVNLGEIAQHVWQATRKGQPHGVKLAAKKFRCHERTVREAWSLYQPIFEKYPALGWGGIPPKHWPK